jgi:hypothetical protein
LTKEICSQILTRGGYASAQAGQVGNPLSVAQMSSDCTSRDVLEHATGRGDLLTRPGRRTLAIRRSPPAVGGVSEPDARADPSSPGGAWACEPDAVLDDPATLGLRPTDSAAGPGARIPVRRHAVEGVFRPHQRLAGSQRRHHQAVPAWRMMSGAWQAQLRQRQLNPSRKPTRLRAVAVANLMDVAAQRHRRGMNELLVGHVSTDRLDLLPSATACTRSAVGDDRICLDHD